MPEILSKEVVKFLSEQHCREIEAAHFYSHLANSFQVAGFTGFAAWAKAESVGELEHANKISEFAAGLGAEISVTESDHISAPDNGTLLEFVNAVIDVEVKFLNYFAEALGKEMEAKNYVTQQFLLQMIEEQRGSISGLLPIQKRIEMVGDDYAGQLQIDSEMVAK